MRSKSLLAKSLPPQLRFEQRHSRPTIHNAFCLMVSEIQSAREYEDDPVIAVMNIAPLNFGHTLIVTRPDATLLTCLNHA